MQKVDCSPIPGVWVPYVGVRHKEPYDLLLKDGTILKSAYPNGIGWGPAFMKVLSPNWAGYVGKDITDSDIVAMYMLTDADIHEREISHNTGNMRFARLTHHKGYEQKVTIFHESELLKDDEVRDLVNVLTEKAESRHAADSLREVLSKQVKKVIDRFRSK